MTQYHHPGHMELSDEEIVEEVLAGDKDLFELLVTRYQRPVYNLMYRHSGNGEEAADLAQDVFVRAYDKLWLFDKQKRFFPWLYRIAINHASDWNRKKNRRLSKRHLLEQDAFQREQSVDQQKVVEGREDKEKVRTALKTLPQDTREILLFRFQHDCRIKEVASIFKMSESAVKMRIKRGLESLKKTLKQE